jgi:hypothetical protein
VYGNGAASCKVKCPANLQQAGLGKPAKGEALVCKQRTTMSSNGVVVRLLLGSDNWYEKRRAWINPSPPFAECV